MLRIKRKLMLSLKPVRRIIDRNKEHGLKPTETRPMLTGEELRNVRGIHY
jgi:hypothetical protein